MAKIGFAYILTVRGLSITSSNRFYDRERQRWEAEVMALRIAHYLSTSHKGQFALKKKRAA